jgi:hypothetical protein
VVVAAEVEDAMHRGLGHVGAVLGADRDVAELTRSGGGAGAVDREGEDVGWRVLATVLAVELADALGVDQLDGEMALLDVRGGERRQRDGTQLLGSADEVQFDQFSQACWRRGPRSAGACCSAYSL